MNIYCAVVLFVACVMVTNGKVVIRKEGSTKLEAEDRNQESIKGDSIFKNIRHFVAEKCIALMDPSDQLISSTTEELTVIESKPDEFLNDFEPGWEKPDGYDIADISSIFPINFPQKLPGTSSGPSFGGIHGILQGGELSGALLALFGHLLQGGGSLAGLPYGFFQNILGKLLQGGSSAGLAGFFQNLLGNNLLGDNFANGLPPGFLQILFDIILQSEMFTGGISSGGISSGGLSSGGLSSGGLQAALGDTQNDIAQSAINAILGGSSTSNIIQATIDNFTPSIINEIPEHIFENFINNVLDGETTFTTDADNILGNIFSTATGDTGDGPLNAFIPSIISNTADNPLIALFNPILSNADASNTDTSPSTTGNNPLSSLFTPSDPTTDDNILDSLTSLNNDVFAQVGDLVVGTAPDAPADSPPPDSPSDSSPPDSSADTPPPDAPVDIPCDCTDTCETAEELCESREKIFNEGRCSVLGKACSGTCHFMTNGDKTDRDCKDFASFPTTDKTASEIQELVSCMELEEGQYTVNGNPCEVITVAKDLNGDMMTDGTLSKLNPFGCPSADAPMICIGFPI